MQTIIDAAADDEEDAENDDDGGNDNDSFDPIFVLQAFWTTDPSVSQSNRGTTFPSDAPKAVTICLGRVAAATPPNSGCWLHTPCSQAPSSVILDVGRAL